jgi:hypothetical protein
MTAAAIASKDIGDRMEIRMADFSSEKGHVHLRSRTARMCIIARLSQARQPRRLKSSASERH